jgi:serine/threonine-protein phosphatase 2B catalytic subunit
MHCVTDFLARNREGRLTEEQAMWIIREATKLLREEPNMLEVDAPITG